MCTEVVDKFMHGTQLHTFYFCTFSFLDFWICSFISEYSRLKEKYAANLIANWQESSDAEKSVHEDLGIAAYLSCLWQGNTTSFVDLGCGNGLLVFILTSEVSCSNRLSLMMPARYPYRTIKTNVADTVLDRILTIALVIYQRVK